jgi:F-type H+/Na+-transporting ATPase subunit alpha
MADLTLSASDIAAAITKGLDGYKPSVEARTVGRVTEVDQIAQLTSCLNSKTALLVWH